MRTMAAASLRFLIRMQTFICVGFSLPWSCFLSSGILSAPSPLQADLHFGIMAEGGKAKAGMARHRSSTLPSLFGLLRLKRIAARKGYNPKFCASCIFYL